MSVITNRKQLKSEIYRFFCSEKKHKEKYKFIKIHKYLRFRCRSVTSFLRDRAVVLRSDVGPLCPWFVCAQRDYTTQGAPQLTHCKHDRTK